MTDQFINSSGEVLAELDTAGTARLPMRRGVSEEFFQGALATQRAVEAVLKLHESGNYSDGNNYCILCSRSGVLCPYPCQTVAAIQSALGESSVN
mgnify:FL=1